MSPAAVLKKVKEKYPELSNFSRTELRLVEDVVRYVGTISGDSELLSDEEQKAILEKRGPITPGGSLRAYRVREELTQAQLAKKCGIPQGNLSAMENNRRPIGLNMAKKLAQTLNCNYKKLV